MNKNFTSIRLTKEVRDKLVKQKNKKGLKSNNEYIRRLIDVDILASNKENKS